jgi:hypothetical protein
MQHPPREYFSATLAALKMPTSTDSERFIAALAGARHAVDMKVSEIIKDALQENDKQTTKESK